ncbi:hypothetical protein KAS45_06700 [candidate division WOR-3 bacterium]|nr:hypothetical protein [candidate division WOR-3 bacterium]
MIKTFFDNDLIKCDQCIIWDGQNNQQRKCAAGVYFLRLEIGDYRDTKKTILMK